jgi:hypothetical protein
MMQRSLARAPAEPGQPAVPNLTLGWQSALQRASLGAAALVPAELALRAGTRCGPGGVEVRFLARDYLVDLARGAVRAVRENGRGAGCWPGRRSSGEPGAKPGRKPGGKPGDWPDKEAEHEPDILTRTLLLHYLATADGSPIEGVLASFRELPGGQVYYAPFQARVTGPLVARFGAAPADLVRAGIALGGRPCALGEGGVELDVLPRLPVSFGVWSGDEEVSASGVVLFDRSAPHYLSLEDLVVASGQAVRALIGALQSRGGAGAAG